MQRSCASHFVMQLCRVADRYIGVRLKHFMNQFVLGGGGRQSVHEMGPCMSALQVRRATTLSSIYTIIGMACAACMPASALASCFKHQVHVSVWVQHINLRLVAQYVDSNEESTPSRHSR